MAWLNAEYGILPVLAALVLLTGAFILLWKCAKNSDRLSRYLYAVLLLRTILGLIANLLVVYSTNITPLMMGLMPWDLIFVIMILWTRQNGDNNAE
jgi:cytochrome c biogenesis factor